MPGERLRFAVDRSHYEVAVAQGLGERPDAAIEGVVRLAKAADAAGVDSFWLSEDPDGWDAIAMLGAIARETVRIRLGPGVLNPYFRHPSLIAASMSTLDALAGGRAFLGFGRGQTEWYERALGMEVGWPVTALEESFQLLRQWLTPPWTAEAAADASAFRVTRWERVTGPVQEHLPMYLAAVGPKAMSLAARYADGVIFNDLSSMTFMEAAIRDVRRDAAEQGRDAEALRFFARAAVTITDDPEAVWQRRKATVALIHALPGMERLLESPGFDTAAIIAEVRTAMRTMEVLERGGNFPELKQAGDMAAARRAIPDDLMRELVVAGPMGEVWERLRQFREIGITDVFLAPPTGDPDELTDIVAALVDA
ncbi:MAG TPA: LLM class flavin-dependent oxidoreductase [Thermomicrobiales bacterium]|nr:LLM class flavin-dependent oxidoreductase [Thermomicrobiales bacterium]